MRHFRQGHLAQGLADGAVDPLPIGAGRAQLRMLQSPGVGSVQVVIAIGPSSASTTSATLTDTAGRARL